MRCWIVILCLLPALSVGPRAAADVVALTPDHGSVAFRAYGLGLLPLDGQFTRFRGQFSYDPEDHAHCSVSLQVDAGSLAMRSAAVGERVRGTDFLDTARFPALTYDGACDTTGLNGQLAMHGVTRPFALTLDWGTHAVTAVGRLRRADWGMTAHPLLGGSTVRITVSVVGP